MKDKKTQARLPEDFFAEYPELDYRLRLDFDPKMLNSDEIALLKNVMSDICFDLTIYIELFSDEDSREKLLNFNEFIFICFEQALIEKIVLRVAKLMDREKMGGHSNLSLIRFVNKSKSPLLIKKYKNLESFYKRSGMKKWRDKLLAHSDLKTIKAQNFEIDLKKSELDSYLAEIQSFVDILSDPEVTTDHRVKLPYGKDVQSFLKKLVG